MEKVARINIDDYFMAGSKSLLKREKDINSLLLRLTIVVDGIQDWIDEHEEKEHQKLMDLICKISHELTPRIWKLENPGKDISEAEQAINPKE